jgi:hypothetical protein
VIIGYEDDDQTARELRQAENFIRLPQTHFSLAERSGLLDPMTYRSCRPWWHLESQSAEARRSSYPLRSDVPVRKRHRRDDPDNRGNSRAPREPPPLWTLATWTKAVDERNLRLSGGCLCGAVRYRVKAAPRVHYCHCDMCRRATGSAFAVLACRPRFRFEAVPGPSKARA